jgi:hypothetical protein
VPDRIALPLIVLAAAGMIALALVWPQGQGARSPTPFGHPLAAPEKAVAAPPGRTGGEIRGAARNATERAEDALHE